MYTQKLKLTLILHILNQISSYSQDQIDETTSFRFAILYVNKANKLNTIELDKEIITLEQTDKVKIFIEPLDNQYIYIFLIDFHFLKTISKKITIIKPCPFSLNRD